ncbi:hypothetical protein ACGFZL_03225 [Streptomyces sp. NPDC048182]|uniref:hypothetical protein n=1 Tax=Streptomyces sp. NPDC048182 TaxID=3365507 RepID=UPI00371BB913
MPRGRHRHSPPLHRLLPPSAIAGVSVVCAAGPWVFDQAPVLRALAAAAAVTAVVGAVVMRHWDAQAGRRVADLTRARASDEWRYEERVAELESDLEESRELRQKLEHRLRAKRTELAGLRGEHAALLRRYATAETERASALEGRRLLAIEAAPTTRAALPAARPAPLAEAAAAKTAERAPGVFSPAGAGLYQQAGEALARLEAAPATASPDGDGPVPDAPGTEGDAQGKPSAVDGHGHERTAAAGTPAHPTEPTEPAEPTEPTGRAEGHFTVPTAVAVAPAAPARRRPVEGGFDFFGTKGEGAAEDGSAPAALAAVQNEDLADVVGQEALALHEAEAETAVKPAGPESRAVGQVIDLTAHDETEQIDVQELRGAVS